MRHLASLMIAHMLLLSACVGADEELDGMDANRVANAYYDECVEGCVSDRGLDEEECSEACADTDDGDCAAGAEAAWQDCIDSGGSDEECSAAAEGSYEACVGVERSTSADPCDEAADSAYEACLYAGGTKEECREAAESAYVDCRGATTSSGTTTTRT